MSEETSLSGFKMPDILPVMVLGGGTLFPNTLLPLFVFEERYRAMLECALETDRLVAIAMPRPGNENKVYPVAGVGLVRACVRGDDGTSNVILQGVGRVRFNAWPQLVPFRKASVEPFGRIDPETQEEREARLCTLRVFMEKGGLRVPAEIGSQLGRIEDPDALTDIAASAFLTDPDQRQTVLEQESNLRRQEVLLQLLRLNAG
jgi:ATP-dependent Lon protease